MNAAAEAVMRLTAIRRLALALCALGLAVVGISAYVRLGAAGFGCADWPACYGQILAGKANLHSGIVRILHRSGASLALVLAFVLAWRCLQPRPLQPAARHATALVVLMMFLAAVGIWSADPHRAGVTFINILGGLGLVSLAWRVVSAAGPMVQPLPRDALLTVGLAALAATMLLGALIGARYAAASCTTLPDCDGVWGPSAAGWAGLNPFATIAAALPPGDDGGVALHLLHRYCALATLLLLGVAARRGLHHPATRNGALALVALLAVEVALGGLTVASGFNIWLGIGHSMTAAALLAAVANCRRRLV